MTDKISGYTMNVSTPYMGGGGFSNSRYDVHISDKIAAIDAVRKYSNSSDDIEITVLAELNATTLAGLGIPVGEVRAAV